MRRLDLARGYFNTTQYEAVYSRESEIWDIRRSHSLQSGRTARRSRRTAQESDVERPSKSARIAAARSAVNRPRSSAENDYVPGPLPQGMNRAINAGQEQIQEHDVNGNYSANEEPTWEGLDSSMGGTASRASTPATSVRNADDGDAESLTLDKSQLSSNPAFISLPSDSNTSIVQSLTDQALTLFSQGLDSDTDEIASTSPYHQITVRANERASDLRTRLGPVENYPNVNGPSRPLRVSRTSRGQRLRR